MNEPVSVKLSVTVNPSVCVKKPVRFSGSECEKPLDCGRACDAEKASVTVKLMVFVNPTVTVN